MKEDAFRSAVTLIKSYLYMIVAAGILVGYAPHLAASIKPRIDVELGALAQLAWVLWGGGGALIAASVWYFGTGAGSSPAFNETPKRLVVRGPYRHVRNPMYVGQLIVIAGHFLWTGTLSILIYFGAYALGVYLISTRYEQPLLKNLFPQAFEHYRSHVPAWIPSLRPYDPSA